eukprot:1161997-Pelagomonas_calceolata.AAC.10
MPMQTVKKWLPCDAKGGGGRSLVEGLCLKTLGGLLPGNSRKFQVCLLASRAASGPPGVPPGLQGCLRASRGASWPPGLPPGLQGCLLGTLSSVQE